MTRRIRSEDLDHLLDLVEKNRTQAAHGADDTANGADGAALDLQHNGPIWSSNHEFWLEQLRQETSGSWSEQQYADAASLINFAEYQRVVLNDFMQVLAGPEIDSELTGTAQDWQQDWQLDLAAASSDASAGTDQIQLRPEFSTPSDHDGGENAVPAGDTVSRAHDDKGIDSEQFRSDRVDLAAISAIRSRETGGTQFNQIRADLYVQTGLTSLRPYSSWDDFQTRNNLSDGLVADLESAYPDGFDAVDMWVAGLAEVEGAGAEGSTLQAAISDQVGRLHNASAGMGVHDLAGTGMFARIETLSFADIVQRHSGASHGDASAVASLNDLTLASPIIVAPPTSGQIITGTDHDDVLFGGDADDIIYGGAGDDFIVGGAGDDIIIGGKGHDRLHGGSGADHLKGGAGDDSLSGDDGDDDLDGGTGSDDLHGGAGADLARGGTGDDQLYGDAGDDTLDGEDGADIMAGGLGNDTIYVDDRHDQAVEAAGEGTDTVRTGLDVYTLPENVEILIYIGHSDFIGTGNELANYMAGGDGGDILTGGAGDDTLAGGAGDDILIGGSGANVLIGGLGSDVIVLTNASDVVIENAGEGTDTIATTLNAYALNDNVEILVFIGDGDFAGSGNALDNRITGGSGNDTLYGGAGNDTLDGGSGDNTLDGGDGNDYVINGQGNDFVMFTRGSDTLVLRQGFGNDVVIGFDTNSSGQGAHDRIDVSSYGFHEDAFGVDILLIYDGDSTTLRIGADSVKLVLVDVNTMDRHDFIFSQ